jgi:hypothetical protein
LRVEIPGRLSSEHPDSTIAAALFDFDETIIDLEAEHVAASTALCRERGADFERLPDSIRRASGTRIIDELRLIREHFGWRDPDDALLARRLQLFDEICRTAALEPMPGVREVVRALRERGIPLAITTSAVREAIETILEGRSLTVVEHLSLDDSDIVFCIKQWSRSADPILADLCRRFLNRRLFKAFDLDMPEEEREAFISGARSVVERGGYDPEYYFVEDEAGDAEHYFYSRDRGIEKDLIFVEYGFSRPEIREISEVSAAVRGLQKGYTLLRACFPGEVKKEIASFYRDRGPESRGTSA